MEIWAIVVNPAPSGPPTNKAYIQNSRIMGGKPSVADIGRHMAQYFVTVNVYPQCIKDCDMTNCCTPVLCCKMWKYFYKYSLNTDLKINMKYNLLFVTSYLELCFPAKVSGYVNFMYLSI